MNFASARIAALLVAICCAGCSGITPWINQPLQPGGRIDSQAIAQRDSSALFAVTLSGGGARAAAFAYGVMKELRATRWASDLTRGATVGRVAEGDLIWARFREGFAARVEGIAPEARLQKVALQGLVGEEGVVVRGRAGES